MPLRAGDRIPEVTLSTMTPDGPRSISTSEVFEGKRVVLFAVPGAFTPTCSDYHLPGFVEAADEVRARGIDLVACTAVNDVYVMDAWAQARHVGDRILMLADGNGDFARAMGLEQDSSRFGMGKRSRRYAAVVENGTIRTLLVDEPGQLQVSSAEAVLTALAALDRSTPAAGGGR
jgi:glutaredoxin/glutathione-dependent peroxiredoxin